MRSSLFAFAALMAGLTVSACSGSGGTSPIPASNGGTSPSSTDPAISMKMIIANVAAPAVAKRRNFVSPSTQGVVVVSYAHSDTNHATPLGTTTTNVSSGSSACTTSGGNRSCTIPIVAPAGDDDFVFTLYDTAPTAGAIPPGAHVLGTAGVTQTIVANQTNTVTAGISGVIAGLSGQTAQVNIASQAQNIGLTIDPTDFGNQQITQGTTNSPFANPITVTVSESGGSGHATLELDGGTPATSVTVTKASDTVQLVYDGLATAGYSASVTLSTSASNGIAAASESATITPVLFVTNPTVFYAQSSGTLNTYPAGEHVLAISEPSGTPTFTATPSGCSGILRVGTMIPTSGSPTKATLLVVAGTTISSSGCTVAISDGTYIYTVAVTNQLRTDSATHTITEYPVGANAPFGIATGADGNLWFAENDSSSPAISSVTSSGSNYTRHVMPSATSAWKNPFGVALGGDGNIWVGDDNSTPDGDMGKVTPSGTITTYYAPSQFTNFDTPDLTGLMWFSECSTNSLASVSTSGTITNVSVSGAEYIQGVTIGPDGNVWFTDLGSKKVGKIVNGSASLVTPALENQPSTAEDIAAGSDGNLWVTELATGSNGIIAQISTGGAILNEFTSGIGNPGFIVPGPDGALWFTDLGNEAIGRISTTGTVTEYPIPSMDPTLEGITVGPDGNIWFTEESTGKIGVLKL